MTDAISRSAVLDFLTNNIVIREDEIDLMEEVCHAIKVAPSLDVAQVVHAHWIKTFGSDGFVSALRCSKCGNAENSTYIPGNFCWFCGARMDGEENAAD